MNWISTSDYGKLMIGEPELLVFLVLINSFMSLTKWKVLTDTFLLPFFRQQKKNKEHQLLCILNISSSCRIYHHPSRRPTEVSQFCAARIASKCKNENVERKQKQVDTQLIFVHLLKFLFLFFSFFAHFWLFNNFYCVAIVFSRHQLLFSPGCWRVLKWPGQEINDLSRSSSSIAAVVGSGALVCWTVADLSEIIERKKRQMISLTPFIRETQIHHANVLFLCPFLTKVARFDHYSSYPDCLTEKSEKISESFFKRVGSYKSFGKVFWARHTTGKGQRRESPLFMSFHANSNEFEFLSPDDDGENEATGTTQPTARLVNFGSLFLKEDEEEKRNWWYIQYISFIFPFLRVSFDGF